MAGGPHHQGPLPGGPGAQSYPPEGKINRTCAGEIPGSLSIAAATAGALVFMTPGVWALALPISSIAMILGLIGLQCNSRSKSSRMVALLGLVAGVVMTVTVAVHLNRLPPGKP
jgi:hypothetical protein